jgi:hypothetical protein
MTRGRGGTLKAARDGFESHWRGLASDLVAQARGIGR